MSTDSQADPARLIDLIGACWTTQVLHVAAALGLADLLAQQPATADDLATRTHTDAGALQRLLRALASLGLCVEREDGRYALAPAGQPLRSDAPYSLRALAIWWGRYCWSEMQGLHACVQSGSSARSRGAGEDGYAHLARDADAAAVFHRAMRERTRLIAGRLAALLDLSQSTCVLDVGGGEGELIAALLSANPKLRGVLLDLPHAFDGARKVLAASGVEQRCALLAGDFFDTLPPGADLLVLKSVLHNWDDGRAARILANCRTAMAASATLVVVERILPPRMDNSAACRAAMRADLNMLVGPGGRERQLSEFNTLLSAAGLTLQAVDVLDGELSAMRATAN
ncbi:MAG: hypothetical protein JNM98_21140 [Rhodocyclaceae bacterium]|nr:hypothetical protein [Rhodocyclaceae bacterium]